jgi:hypothetical protein
VVAEPPPLLPKDTNWRELGQKELKQELARLKGMCLYALVGVCRFRSLSMYCVCLSVSVCVRLCLYLSMFVCVCMFMSVSVCVFSPG